MAHEIDVTAGRASFVSANKPAWHRLGVTFDGLLTVPDALEQANLAGWNVRKVPSIGVEVEVTDDGVTEHRVEVAGRYAVIRTNPVTGKREGLGNVGEKYAIFQNEQVAEFLAALLDQSGAFIETAGALAGGRRVFYCAKLPQDVMVGGVDPVNLYSTVLNSHDGTTGLRALVSPVRVVCANTERAAIGSAQQQWSIRHTAGGIQAVQEARETLELTWRFVEAFEAEAERMIQQTITNGEFDTIIRQVLDVEDKPGDTKRTATNKRQKFEMVRKINEDSRTQDVIRGTRWGAYNALTEYVDHFAPVRAAGSDDVKAAARANAAIDDFGVKLKEKAFTLLSVPA